MNIVTFIFVVIVGSVLGRDVYNDKVNVNRQEREISQAELLGRIKDLEHQLKAIQADAPYQRWAGPPGPPGRKRRDVNLSEQGSPTTQGCIPGTPGCTGYYTPFYSGNCYMCPSGPKGSEGEKGPPGRDGRDGRDGLPGLQCQGTVEITGPKTTDTHPTNGNFSNAVAYVRWGRTVCESPSELVYSGVVGGSHYSQQGGGTNYLCLPKQPIYDRPTAGAGGLRNYVYGAEYQTNDFPPLASVHDFDVPCALCLARGSSTKIMMPAQNICPEGWNTEYSGYLMTERTHDAHRRSEYICVDGSPEVIERSNHDTNGILLHVAESRCSGSGSGLPCGAGGYVDGFELTCAICSL